MGRPPKNKLTIALNKIKTDEYKGTIWEYLTLKRYCQDPATIRMMCSRAEYGVGKEPGQLSPRIAQWLIDEMETLTGTKRNPVSRLLRPMLREHRKEQRRTGQ